MPVNFQGQTSHEVSIPPVLPFIEWYSSPYLLVILISDLSYSEISCGHPIGLRPCSRFAFMVMLTLVKGETIPEARIPHVLPMIVFYKLQSLLVIWTTNFKRDKIYFGCPLRGFIWSIFSLIAMPTHFQGKTSCKALIHLYCWWLSAIAQHLC